MLVNQDEFDTSNLKKAGYDSNPIESDELKSKYDLHLVPMTRLAEDSVIGLGLSPKEAARCKNFFAYTFAPNIPCSRKSRRRKD